MKASDFDEVTSRWSTLNQYLLLTHDEKVLHAMIEHEIKTRRRRQIVFRIHARLNRVRAMRERAQLEDKLNGV